MSWLSRLFAKKSDTALSDLVKLSHTRGYTHDIVGEASYQSGLARIAGAKDADSKNHECSAILICELDNPHDSNAVAVMINGRKVGYLSRDAAQSYRAELAAINSRMPNAQVRAQIIGGWKNDDSEGHYGVKLNLKRPIALAR